MIRQRSLLISLIGLFALVLASSAPARAARATIELRDGPGEGNTMTLAVGESHTFEITVESDEAFAIAQALQNAYYPGRGLNWRSSGVVTNATHASLYLTATAKSSTADLPAVCDWPEPGLCWHPGTAPISIVAGARYKGGQLLSEQFNFGIIVP